MDQLSAHLDRGWDLVQRGDPRGAELSARRALELDSQSPEAYNLLGYVAALQGEYEDAIDNYRQAIALDDGYLEAMLNAAELYVHPIGEFDDAIALCDLALDVAETDDEAVDALLLKFDALLGKGEPDQARELCTKFPTGPFENPNHTFLVGRALYEIGETERAVPLIEEAVKRNGRNGEALYYLGLVRDEGGDPDGATTAFLASREIDLDTPPPAWSVSRETFADSVSAALARLAPPLSARVSAGEVFVADVPGVEVIVDGVDPRALVLVDAPNAESNGNKVKARLFVYQRNVERLAGSVELVEGEILAALEREIAATFSEGERESDPSRLN